MHKCTRVESSKDELFKEGEEIPLKVIRTDQVDSRKIKVLVLKPDGSAIVFED